jgi:hypothetical protein
MEGMHVAVAWNGLYRRTQRLAEHLATKQLPPTQVLARAPKVFFIEALEPQKFNQIG